jgi:nitroreductase
MGPGMDAPVQTAAPADAFVTAQWAAALIGHRQTVRPRRLAAPGPDEAQLELILNAAAAAPDHGELVPWRFVIIPAASRARLAQVFASSLLERDPRATADQLEQARDKAFRAPLLMLAIARTGFAGDEVPAPERLISAGCAIQNMLLMATAMGFGSALTSGKAITSPALERLFGIEAGEQALCFVSIGTAARRKPPRARPSTGTFVSILPPSP